MFKIEPHSFHPATGLSTPGAWRYALAVAAAFMLIAPAARAGSRVTPSSHTPAPTTVTLVGSLQNELGCANDWDPSCSATRLTYDAFGQVWRGSFSVPAGNYEYKVAINDSWIENYPTANINLSLGAGRVVKFYYSHDTHWITSDFNSRIATAAGSFQSELGCSGDWQPDCLRSWLQDPDGDGVFTFSTTALPAGTYEAKVTIGESWSESYGEGGSPSGGNIGFTVGSAGTEILFHYDDTSHILSIGPRSGAHDGTVSWSDLLHDSRSTLYRTPGGAVPAGTAVTLRLRALAGDLTGAQVRVWNDRTNSEMFLPMTLAASDGSYDWWQATVAPGIDPTVLLYRFIAVDGSAAAYYEDDAARDGGPGTTLGATADRGWQITLYDPSFTTPSWVKDAIVYQIFPDRFRNGNPANDTPAGTFFYGETGGTILRSGQANWNEKVCDPRDLGGPCPGKYGSNFYGGDLQGVIDKLPYLKNLGVSVLYLNPIFESPSNHKFDVSDYKSVDDNLGNLALFQTLTFQAHAEGMKVVLDGAFNATSSDSLYFDRYSRYGGDPGACESVASPYRTLYFFSGSGPCTGNSWAMWMGDERLPQLNPAAAATRTLLWDDLDAAARYWLAQGADGWRVDAGGAIDPGVTGDVSNSFWEGFRAAVRGQKADAWIVGEEWGVATSWTLGAEWDSATNYPFSSAVLGFWRDTTFTDNDHDTLSAAGPLSPLTPSQLDARLRNLAERYPAEALYAMMNVLGTHDTSRVLFMLDHRTDEGNPAIYQNPFYDWSDAIQRLKGAALLQMTLPGAPTIYYGDEVGLVGPVASSGGTWQDDPYNRQPYPWLDESGTPFYVHLQSGGDGQELRAHYELLAATRNAHPALRTGSFDTLRVDDAANIYAYGRKLADSSDAAVVMINRAASSQSIAVSVGGYLANGAVFHDVLDGNATYTVSGGLLTVPNVPARSGALLVLSSTMPAPPAGVTTLAVTGVTATSVSLSWSAASGATSYDVYRSLLSGGGYTLVASTGGTSFSVTGLPTQTRQYFVVVSRSAAGLAGAMSNEVSATPEHDLSNPATSWFAIQWPPQITHTISATNRTDTIYAQIWINGATEPAGAAAGIRAQVGYGPDGSNPGVNWQWSEMSFHTQVGNNDEYAGSLLPDQVGEFDFAVRFSSDGGATWWYADLEGPQRSGTLSNPGRLIVNGSDDGTAPAAPEGLTVVSASTTAIELGWSANTDTDLAGYEIFREDVASPGYALLASVSAAATSYIDSAVTPAATYRYYLKAFDTSFNRSATSNVVETTAAPRYVDVVFDITVPSFTPASATVSITGSLTALGSWNPAGSAATKVSATQWTYTLNVLDGTSFGYTFTRGTWETVEAAADGSTTVMRDAVATYGTTGTQNLSVTVQNWRDPIVVSHLPAAGATNVPVSSTVGVTWSQVMPSTSDFSVTTPGGSVPGTFSHNSGTRTTTFTPSAPLAQGVVHTVSVAGKQSAAGNTQQVPVSWTFTTACNVMTPAVSAGGPVTFCSGGSVTLTSSSSGGNQWYRNGTPIGGATGTSYVATQSGSYTVRVTVEGCTSLPSNSIDVTVNPVPAVPTITPGGATTFCSGGSVTLTSSSATGNQWYRNGVTIAGETGQVLVVADPGSYTVQVTAAGCSSGPSAPTVVTVYPRPNVSITAPSAMSLGAAATATVNASCSEGTIVWSIAGGSITAGQGTSHVDFTADAVGTATLTVTVTNAWGCSDTKSVAISVEMAPFGAPPYMRATASGSSALVRWAPVQSAATYEVYRSADHATWTLRGTTGSLSFTDSGLAGGTAYLYRVRAMSAGGGPSPFSLADVATTLPFSDDPAAACGGVIRAAHIVELRQSVNAARALFGLSEAGFTDPSLAPGVAIRAVHVTELRSALAPVLAALGVTPSYTDPVITPGVTPAKAAHVNELRDRLR